MPTTFVKLTGNTYPVKDKLRALGGQWDKDNKCWMIPADKEDEANALLTQPSATPGKCRKCGKSCDPKYDTCYACKPAPRQCRVCGHRPDPRNHYDRIYKSGECRDCYEERKMGY